MFNMKNPKGGNILTGAGSARPVVSIIIPSKSKYSAPTFTIFLDCVWQVRLFC